MTMEKFVGYAVAAVVLMLLKPVFNDLLQAATLDSMTRDVLGIFFNWVLSPFGVIGGLIVWVTLSRRNAW